MECFNRQLVVFDFDWSMADQDTDAWTLEVLAPDIRRKVGTLPVGMEWTDFVAHSLQELHSRGVTREQIEDNLRIMPFHPAMVRGVTNLKAAGKTTFLCLSSANTIFISTILESKGLQTLFDEIITNPAEWDPSGLLKLRRKVDPNGPQHKCAVGCSPNMCKGEELDAFLAKHPPVYDRIIYVGDGGNDFCPVLRLRSHDTVLCRRHLNLEKRIASDGKKLGLCCKVEYWTGAWEVEEFLNKMRAETAD